MKILVTGGAGFIGSHIVDKYLDLGHQVYVVDDLSNGKIENINKRANFLKIDIRDYEELEEVFKRFNFEIINHHASQINVDESIKNSKLYFDVNVLGTVNLLELSKKYKVKRFIFASSGGAINNNEEKFNSIYGLNKFICEKYLIHYHYFYGIEYVSLRYGNVYGPRQQTNNYSGVIAIFSMNFLNNKPFTIFGDGKQTRDFIYIDDVVKANILALDSQVGIYNIGYGNEVSILDLVGVFEEIKNEKIEILFLPKKKGDVDKSVLNIEETVEKLNWKPEIDLKTGVLKTIQWLKEKINQN